MTANAGQPPHPELDKLTAVQDQYFAIEQFLDWLGSHSDYALACHNRCLHWAEALQDIPECFGRNPECPANDHPDHRVNMAMPIILLTADERSRVTYEYFDLDGQAIARERLALLKHVPGQAAAR